MTHSDLKLAWESLRRWKLNPVHCDQSKYLPLKGKISPFDVDLLLWVRWHSTTASSSLKTDLFAIQQLLLLVDILLVLRKHWIQTLSEPRWECFQEGSQFVIICAYVCQKHYEMLLPNWRVLEKNNLDILPLFIFISVGKHPAFDSPLGLPAM